MLPHTARAPLKLRIWQQSTCKSLHNTDYILNQANPKDFNLLLIQEPWFNRLGKSRGTPNWWIIYPPSIYQEHHKPICLIILVNTNISTETYTALTIPSGDITATWLKGDFGQCTIFNIYNDCTNNNTIHSLSNYLTAHAHTITPELTNHMLWCGDFNHHHPLWEEEYNKHLFSSPDMINPLINLVIK